MSKSACLFSFIYDEWVPELVEGVESFHRTDHGFDESYLLFREAVFLVEHLVCPRVREVLEGDELIDRLTTALIIFLHPKHCPKELCFHIRPTIIHLPFIIKIPNYYKCLCT